MDRRALPPALVALAVIALWAWVLPWVNGRVAWDDPVRPGEAIQVTDDVTMTAAPGWGVVAGLRTTDETRSGERAVAQVVLVKAGVAFSILQGPFDGTPQELLDQAETITATGGPGFRVSGEARDVTTNSGLRGVAEPFTSARSTGEITTFVVSDTGIEIQVVGADAQMAALRPEIDSMIDSLAQEEAS